MKHRWNILVVVAALAFALSGCQEKPQSPIASDPGPSNPAVPSGDPKGGTTPDPAPSKGAADDKKDAGVALADIPASLKHDGFRYYGFAHSGEIDYQLVDSTGAISTGSTRRVLRKLETNPPRLLVSEIRSGNLAAQMPSIVYSVEPTGVYAESMEGATMKPHSLEVPSALKPGNRWKSKVEIERAGSKMVYDASYHVVGVQKIKTKAGEFDALLIESTGPVTTDRTATMKTRNWFVKDLGLVKIEYRTSTPVPGNKPAESTMVYEATKI